MEIFSNILFKTFSSKQFFQNTCTLKGEGEWNYSHLLLLKLYLKRKVLLTENTGKFGSLIFLSEENVSFILIFKYSFKY